MAPAHGRGRLRVRPRLVPVQQGSASKDVHCCASRRVLWQAACWLGACPAALAHNVRPPRLLLSPCRRLQAAPPCGRKRRGAGILPLWHAGGGAVDQGPDAAAAGAGAGGQPGILAEDHRALAGRRHRRAAHHDASRGRWVGGPGACRLGWPCGEGLGGSGCMPPCSKSRELRPLGRTGGRLLMHASAAILLCGCTGQKCARTCPTRHAAPAPTHPHLLTCRPTHPAGSPFTGVTCIAVACPSCMTLELAQSCADYVVGGLLHYCT